MKIRNVLSCFDGISAGIVALQRAGIEFDNYYAFEIDKFAIKCSTENHPNIIQLGDINNWKDNIIEDVDLIIGGNPCNSFSFAGKGLAFDDPRGQLFFTFNDILKFYNPKYFLVENVVMKKEHSDTISEYLGVSCTMLNSSLLSAQNRKRLYWTNFPITIPEDKNIYWKDVKDNNVSIEQYYYTDKGLAWLAQHSHNRDKQLKTFEEDNSKMQMLEASHQKLYSSQRFFGIPDIPLDNEQVAAMRGRRISFNGNRTDSDYTIPITQYLEFRYDNKTNCLTTVSKDNVVVPFTIPNRIPASEFFFRYLTINECEKLQTFPIGYCSILSKSQAYKAIGNSWTVDVIAHIFECMKLYN